MKTNTLCLSLLIVPGLCIAALPRLTEDQTRGVVGLAIPAALALAEKTGKQINIDGLCSRVNTTSGKVRAAVGVGAAAYGLGKFCPRQDVKDGAKLAALGAAIYTATSAVVNSSYVKAAFGYLPWVGGYLSGDQSEGRDAIVAAATVALTVAAKSKIDTKCGNW